MAHILTLLNKYIIRTRFARKPLTCQDKIKEIIRNYNTIN